MRRMDANESDDPPSSCEEDCCQAVYTYKGHDTRPTPPPTNSHSPDMDYLEMDFDDEEAAPPPKEAQVMQQPKPHPPPQPPPQPQPQQQPTVTNATKNVEEDDPYGPSTSSRCFQQQKSEPLVLAHRTVGGALVYAPRTTATWPAREPESHLGGAGELVSPPDLSNSQQQLFHCTMAKRLVMDGQAALSAFLPTQDTPKRTVWTEREACSKQVTQIGVSACGATAVLNALNALRLPASLEVVRAAVDTRQRANDAPLCRYVISRSVAGCTAQALGTGLSIASGGTVSSRHFATWPERNVNLSHWLAYWIDLGAVPIATLNLQAGITDPAKIPDSWHHQMIFGVGPRGIYMANPLECVEEGALWHQLCSDSVLLIRRKDIISRWTGDTDLTILANVPGDKRWTTMNVLGQIVNMVRENRQDSDDLTQATHLKIPACYRAGITIAVPTGSEAHKKLILAPELPLLCDDDED